MLSRRKILVVELSNGSNSPFCKPTLDRACSTRIFSTFNVGLFSIASRTASSKLRVKGPVVDEGRNPTCSVLGGVCCASTAILNSPRHKSTQSIRFKTVSSLDHSDLPEKASVESRCSSSLSKSRRILRCRRSADLWATLRLRARRADG